MALNHCLSLVKWLTCTADNVCVCVPVCFTPAGAWHEEQVPACWQATMDMHYVCSYAHLPICFGSLARATSFSWLGFKY